MFVSPHSPQIASRDLQLEYSRALSEDPFKAALFKIVARCDLSTKTIPDIITATEDYIWLQLVLIREDLGDSSGSERYTLGDFQSKLLDLGSKHFDPQQTNPYKFFRVLLLSAQFERAIDHLYRYESSQVEAVHIAIALKYYGLLRTVASTPDLSLCMLLLPFASFFFSLSFFLSVLLVFCSLLLPLLSSDHGS